MLASIVLDDDPRRIVGPAEMAELLDYLSGLGFDVRLAERDQVDRQERYVPGAAYSEVDFRLLSEGTELVLEWVGSGLAGGLALEAAKAVTKGWLARARRRPEAVQTTRHRSRVLARWHLSVEFGEDFTDEEPVEEREEADGSWTIVFARPGVQAWATVPPNVDDLRHPGSVRTARRRA